MLKISDIDIKFISGGDEPFFHPISLERRAFALWLGYASATPRGEWTRGIEALSLCASHIKIADHSVRQFFPRISVAYTVVYFCCGVYMGLSEREPKSSTSATT